MSDGEPIYRLGGDRRVDRSIPHLDAVESAFRRDGVLRNMLSGERHAPIPWHPDVAEVTRRVVARVIHHIDQLPVGQGDLLSEPVLVAVRRPGKSIVYDVADADGAVLAEAVHRRPRRSASYLGSKALNILDSQRALSFKLGRDGAWTLRTPEGRLMRAVPDIPEDLNGLAIAAMRYEIGDRVWGRRAILTPELAVTSRRFGVPITDSIETDDGVVAVLITGATAPVRSHHYPGLEDGAPFRVLCRLKPIDRTARELVLADWLSPAHGP